MREFDYEAAFHEVAHPAAEALFASHPMLRTLYDYVAAYACDLRQLPSLDMPWPESPTKNPKAMGGSGLAALLVETVEGAIQADTGRTMLQQALWDVPMDVLALAARAVYFQGHWAHGAHAELSRRGHGAYWKFANYADQVLNARLGLPRDRGLVRTTRGLSLAVHEGFLRAQLDVPGTWMWVEIGPATLATQAALRAIDAAHPLPTAMPGAARSNAKGNHDLVGHAQWETWHETVINALEALADRTTPAPWRNIADTYMKERAR